jgi:hypothetical protein
VKQSCEKDGSILLIFILGSFINFYRGIKWLLESRGHGEQIKQNIRMNFPVCCIIPTTVFIQFTIVSPSSEISCCLHSPVCLRPVVSMNVRKADCPGQLPSQSSKFLMFSAPSSFNIPPYGVGARPSISSQLSFVVTAACAEPCLFLLCCENLANQYIWFATWRIS